MTIKYILNEYFAYKVDFCFRSDIDKRERERASK